MTISKKEKFKLKEPHLIGIFLFSRFQYSIHDRYDKDSNGIDESFNYLHFIENP